MPDGLFGVHRIPPGAPATLVAEGDVDLTGVGFLDGRPAAAIIDSNGDRVRPEDQDSFGAVLVDFSDGEQVDVSAARGPEYFTVSATIGGGRMVEGAAVDLTEAFASYGLDGEAVDDWPMPTAAAPYNAAPLYQWPVAAADPDDPVSATLSWVEGPDFDGATNQVTGGWSLVLAAATTGAESLRLDLGEPGLVLTHADFDGRFWIGSFADSDLPDGGQHLPDRIFAVDTQSATPDLVDVGCPPGATGTIDRLGAPQPSVPASTTVPTTTAVPPSTTTGSCGEYGAAENDYPVRRCEAGAAVGGVQLMLIRRGFDIEPDGYFGPATDAAVRQFQSSVGLEVDGLVGPEPWQALYDPTYLPGVDNNDNGSIDPWELILDPGAGESAMSVSFSPLAPAPGGAIEVTGSGCDPGQDVIVWTQGDVGTGAAFENPVTLSATADADGSLVATTTISDALAPGDGFSVSLIIGGMPPAPEDAVVVDGTVGG